MRLDVVMTALPEYLRGAGNTLVLLAISLVLGFALAVPLAVALTSRWRWLSRSVWLYTYVLRGTPLLVQLFIIYFGLAQFPAVRESFAWPLLSSAWFCACLAFVLNTSAYTTEIFAGAIRSINYGEVEAARSIGMNPLTVYRRVLVPAALRRAIPAYGNEAVFMLHATSLASAVTLFDLTAAARTTYSDTYRPFEAFGLVAIFYLAMSFVIAGAFKWAEYRWLAHLKPRASR
jgi:arginine/ornithine transport system permease protein